MIWATTRGGRNLVVQWTAPARWFRSRAARSLDGCLWVAISSLDGSEDTVLRRAIWEEEGSWFVLLSGDFSECRASIEVERKNDIETLVQSDAVSLPVVPPPIVNREEGLTATPGNGVELDIPSRVSGGFDEGLETFEQHSDRETIEGRRIEVGLEIHDLDTQSPGFQSEVVTNALWSLVEPHIDSAKSSWDH